MTDTSFTNFVIKVLTIFAGAEIGQVAGPQVAILAAGTIGASFSLMTRPKGTLLDGLSYLARMAGVAWVFAGTVSAILAPRIGIADPSVIMAGVAGGIGLVGHQWKDIVDWCLDFFRRKVKGPTNDS